MIEGYLGEGNRRFTRKQLSCMHWRQWHRQRKEAWLEVMVKMLRFSLGVMRMGRIRNECIRGTEQVG